MVGPAGQISCFVRRRVIVSADEGELEVLHAVQLARGSLPAFVQYQGNRYQNTYWQLPPHTGQICLAFAFYRPAQWPEHGGLRKALLQGGLLRCGLSDLPNIKMAPSIDDVSDDKMWEEWCIKHWGVDLKGVAREQQT
jgi:hypothetical protein